MCMLLDQGQFTGTWVRQSIWKILIDFGCPFADRCCGDQGDRAQEGDSGSEKAHGE